YELPGSGYGDEFLRDLYKATAPNFHTGGLLDEGLFLGLRGEGVLNKSAMSNIGAEGLRSLNEGKTLGDTTFSFVIQAWDGNDVRRVFEDEIIPLIKETTEAGVEVVHERGIRHEVLV
ncbi:unnamed protein product, partial [marine sediment metagenome]